MPDPNRINVWSEQHDDPTDSTHGIGEDHEDDVLDKPTKNGQLLMANCQTCGRQWKGIIPWTEIVMFYIGDPVDGTRAQKDGIVMGCGCACGKMTPVKVEWDDIRKWVDNGIRIGALLPEVKRMAAQRAAQMAAQRQR